MGLKSASVILALALTGFLTGHASADSPRIHPLFVDVPDETVVLTRAQEARLDLLASEPTTAELNIVQARTSLLTDPADEIPGRIAFNVFPGETFVFARDRITRRSREDISWFGSDPAFARVFASANVVVRGERMFATIHSGLQSLRVLPLGEGLHVVLRMDTRAAPPDEHPDVYRRIPVGIPDSSVPVDHNCRIITVLVAFTAKARDAAGDDPDDIHGVIQLAFDDANQSYINSGITIELNPVFVYETNYVETTNGETDLGLFMGKNDGAMDEVHGFRDDSRADVAVLFQYFIAGYGGLSAAILADEASAFAIVTVGAAPGPIYSFAHEIGHLQGAVHNPEELFDSIPPFDYGHGYPYPQGGWRTIMSYNGVCDEPCPRIQAWSTPDGTYGGVPIGDDETYHAARVLNETACTISGFRKTNEK